MILNIICFKFDSFLFLIYLGQVFSILWKFCYFLFYFYVGTFYPSENDLFLKFLGFIIKSFK